MLIFPNRDNLHKIVVLNPKGGCGKSTLATNIASYYALNGATPALMDCDQQGSSMHWLEMRPEGRPKIHGIPAYKKSAKATRCWQLRVPQGTTHLIVDSPAALGHLDLREVTRDANSILIPVLPSPIDIHAASRSIADLLLVAKIDRQDRQLAVIGNRTRANTKSYEKLMSFNASLGIPVVSILRDTQNYVHAAEKGLGIFEMPRYKVRKDIAQMSDIVNWLETWRERRRDSASLRAQPAREIHVGDALPATG